MLERITYKAKIEHLALLNNKMAFLSGPRQVGKTTLAQMLPPPNASSFYHTWDDPVFRKTWVKNPVSLAKQQLAISTKQWLLLDEIHKAPKWKQNLKAIYDLEGKNTNIVVTGSARLDLFKKGGDSLLGRYFGFRIHPFSVGELGQSGLENPKNLSNALANLSFDIQHQNFYQQLLQFGGFPDPFLKANTDFHRAWVLSRQQRLIREDLFDLTRIREVSLLETMMALLPSKVGSPFSYQSLAEDLENNVPTIKRWTQWMEQLYYVYKINPYTKNIAHSLIKQPKIYMWDWSEVEDTAARFENMVASHLLKACHFWSDTGKGRFELYYVRTKQKKEVDFLITQNLKPWMLVEAKLNDTNLHAPLAECASKLKAPFAIQVVATQDVKQKTILSNNQTIYTLSASSFLSLLP
ncbi:ATP-binding protein [bacterium]|nr:ATP-binding protein [bacterium]